MFDHSRDVITRDFRQSNAKLLKYAVVWSGVALILFWLGIGYFGWAFLFLAASFWGVLGRRVYRDLRASAASYHASSAPVAEPVIDIAPIKSSAASTGLKVPQSLNRDQ